MALKNKETPEERAERLMSQSLALKQRTDWARICEAIKDKPEHLSYFKKYLQTVGAWPTGPSDSARKEAEKKALLKADKTNKEEEPENDRVAKLKNQLVEKKLRTEFEL